MYSNATIQPKRAGKPHIVKDAAWWRVSPTPKGAWKDPRKVVLWKSAYALINRLNSANVCQHCGSQLPPL